MTKIKGVFFDLGWTLDAPVNGNWILHNLFWEKMPERVRQMDAVSIEKLLHGTVDRMFRQHMQMLTPEEEEAAFAELYEEFSEAVGAPLHKKDIQELAHDHTWNAANYYFFDKAKETLQYLHAHGYQVGTITDTWPSTTAMLKAHGIYDLFDTRTYSCELGVFKPDARMYEDALSKMNLPGDQTVFIDDLPKNLLAARNFGIHPVLSVVKPGSQADSRFPNISSPAGIIPVLDQLNA